MCQVPTVSQVCDIQSLNQPPLWQRVMQLLCERRAPTLRIRTMVVIRYMVAYSTKMMVLQNTKRQSSLPTKTQLLRSPPSRRHGLPINPLRLWSTVAILQAAWTRSPTTTLSIETVTPRSTRVVIVCITTLRSPQRTWTATAYLYT